MLTKYAWQYPIEKPITDELNDMFRKRNISPIVAKLLIARGIDNESKLENFFHPNFDQLHDPFLLNDMKLAVQRIHQAINEEERILIYGDYDADGMTSASVVKEALDELGAETVTYLPNRFTDGYGPNEEVYKYYIENENIKLIITVDNGVSGHAAINYANTQSVDVIVTDHHGLPQVLPEAYAIIHPEHPNSEYPFRYLAGVGVAYKLATALLGYPPVESLDLVAIGTIADMVSLTDENRALTSLGLAQLKVTEREGLLALLKLSGTKLSEINEETVGFQIAPRLNALGRIDDPNPAITLLTSFEEDVEQIAEMINQKNVERQEIVKKMRLEAIEMIDNSKSIQILAKENWHPGVLGIVAGHILELTGKPAILLSLEAGVAKGSARSVPALDLFAALDCHRELFTAFGGHAGAAGMTLPEQNISQLSECLEEFISTNNIDLSEKRPLIIDEKIQLSSLNLDLVDSINQLAPFGMDNAKPIFEFENVNASAVKAIGKDMSHLKYIVSSDTDSLTVIAFNEGSKKDLVEQLQAFNICGTLSINEWNGNKNIQLMYKDLMIPSTQVIDIRSRSKKMPENADYLVFNDKLKQKMSNYNLVVTDVNHQTGSLVIVDIPEDISELVDFLRNNDYQLIYFKGYIEQPKYLNGSGTREQFARLFKVLRQYPEFDIRHKLSDLSKYLKIETELLVDMIKIFEELEFVTINEGVMKPNQTPEKKEIETSQLFQNRLKIIKKESFFALESVQTIYQRLIIEE